MAKGPKLTRVRPMARQARLRHEHAEDYPWLIPGVWERAETVAERRRLLLERRGSGGAPESERPLIEGHFEFRGGFPRAVPRYGEQRSPRLVKAGD